MKSNPYGVRFETALLDLMKEKLNIKTPQKVLNYLSDKWMLEHIEWVKEMDSLSSKDVSVEEVPEIKVLPKENAIKGAKIIEAPMDSQEPSFEEDMPEEDVKGYKAHDDIYYLEERANCTELKDVKRLWDMICNDPEMTPNRKKNWESELQIKKLNL